MIINEAEGRMEIEERDINYILQSYIRLYEFQTKNKLPNEIVFPMFSSVPHPTLKGIKIPIQWVPELSGIAVSIKEDGSNIPLPSAESEAIADKKEEDYNAKKSRLDKLAAELGVIVVEPTSKPIDKGGIDLSPSPARVAKAKQPDKPATGPSEYGSSSNRTRDLQQVSRDLHDQPVNEEDEVEVSSIADKVNKTGKE